MIYEALNFVKDRINDSAFFRQNVNTNVKLGDVANLHDSKSELHVLLTIANIEEEILLRNPENYFRRGDSGIYKNPPVFLNVSILFGSYSYDSEDATPDRYVRSIQAVQNIIGFFQGQSVFDHANSPDLDPGIEKLTFELINMNMEQLHHLWSMLGGKYLPSVAYKMRLVMIDTATESPAPLISQIIVDDKVIV